MLDDLVSLPLPPFHYSPTCPSSTEGPRDAPAFLPKLMPSWAMIRYSVFTVTKPEETERSRIDQVISGFKEYQGIGSSKVICKILKFVTEVTEGKLS